uniref:Hexosyltransferase n=1 Tax=Nelumbo nucifera TaxID=4432 RepID=A0A822XYX1_NELNU|nr:TPA_asm: hypothetical protein HUJ06_025753 [Nelumbo nucifera]
MTLDANYLSGAFDSDIFLTINSTFPYLNSNIYHFDSNRVDGKISKSVHQALDQLLNYVCIYLADILPTDVSHAIYLNSDIFMVDDITKLWEVDLEGKVVTAY